MGELWDGSVLQQDVCHAVSKSLCLLDNASAFANIVAAKEKDAECHQPGGGGSTL